MRGSRAVMVVGGCAAIVGAGWAVSPKELPTLDLVAPGGTAEPAEADGTGGSTPVPVATCVPIPTAGDDDDDDHADDDDRDDDDAGVDDRAADDRDDDDRDDDDDAADDPAGDCVTTLVTPSPEAPASDAPADTTAEQTFDGPLVENLRGGYQARITVANGVVVDVAAVVAGTSASESVEINARAIPELRARVLEAQTWDVEAVSGASYTSPAFIESLAGAFSQARL